MGAECDKHGVDLHGDTFNGLVCPVCEREGERDLLLGALDLAMENGQFTNEVWDKLIQARQRVPARNQEQSRG